MIYKRNTTKDGVTITGEITVIEADKLIQIKGSLSKGLEKFNLICYVEWAIYPNDEKKLVINVIDCKPKRTGCGKLLIWHLAMYAQRNGIITIGTDVSALEPGTPEFYDSIGLEPTVEAQQGADNIRAEAAKVENLVERERIINGANQTLRNGARVNSVDDIIEKTKDILQIWIKQE